MVDKIKKVEEEEIEVPKKAASKKKLEKPEGLYLSTNPDGDS
jgi:hypothetical protein